MVFASQFFLFVFLPLVLGSYYYSNSNKTRNIVLVVFSLLFYAYGSGQIVLLLMLSIFINYWAALAIAFDDNEKGRRQYLCLVIFFNLAVLGYFKYYNFFADNVNMLFSGLLPEKNVILPVGISFFTFQCMSYCIDVYRDKKLVQRDIVKLTLYISFFPQLIAGPIVRYSTIAEQLSGRKESLILFNEGVHRFCYGLAKKVLIANSLAVCVDDIFALSPDARSVSVAWLGSVFYSLQIFFDFSGYSDMAIGLAKMFGFKLEENFDYPYISASVSEFWRRWHISLGKWFRNYVYIPLGGNRKGLENTCLNLFIVWILTGLWHGANWTFILWGVLYGVLIIIEHITGLNKKRIPVISHLYTLFFVNTLWVVFRAENISSLMGYVKSMFGLSGNTVFDEWAIFYLRENLVIMVVALILCTPVVIQLINRNKYAQIVSTTLRPITLALLLLVSVSSLVKGGVQSLYLF